MKIGFSTGALFKADIDQNSSEAIEKILSTGVNALEIGCISDLELSKLEKFRKEDLNRFEYLSLHAPGINTVYRDDEETINLLNRIRQLQDIHNFRAIIFHPDRIKDWGVFEKYTDIPIAIENMDINKLEGRSVKEVTRMLKGNDYKMLLDVQHCFSVDPSFALLNELVEKFGRRIVEIHISGQTEKPGQHAPLFETKQENLISAVPDLGVPIIIESPVKQVEDLQEEINYIRKNLK